MPIDPKAEELIQKVLDGIATPQESARLLDLAAKDASVGEELKAQREAADILSQMTPLEAPPDLHRRVMESLPAAPARGTASPPRHGPGSRFPPYLYAAAAGLAVGIVLGPLLLRWLAPARGDEPSSMMGTMAPRERGSDEEAIEEQTIDHHEGRAIVRLLRRDGGCVIEVEQESGQEVHFVIWFDGKAFAVSGIRPTIPPGEKEAAETTIVEGGVAGWLKGHQRIAIDFDRLREGRSEMRFTVMGTDDESIERVLTVPAS